jgi:hypothetical protein
MYLTVYVTNIVSSPENSVKQQDFEGNGNASIKVLSRNLLEGLEKNHAKSSVRAVGVLTETESVTSH